MKNIIKGSDRVRKGIDIDDTMTFIKDDLQKALID